MQDIDAKRYFNEPVDPDALGIPEYRTIIKVKDRETIGFESDWWI